MAPVVRVVWAKTIPCTYASPATDESSVSCRVSEQLRNDANAPCATSLRVDPRPLGAVDADPAPGASDDRKLLLHEQRLGYDGASAARPHKTDGYYDQVNEKNDEITHWRRIVIKPKLKSQDLAINSESEPCIAIRTPHATFVEISSPAREDMPNDTDAVAAVSRSARSVFPVGKAGDGLDLDEEPGDGELRHFDE